MSVEQTESKQPTRILERITLKDQVKNQLKSDILTGIYDSGETYTAGAVAKELAVSLTPVREALLELQSEGLVEILPQIGFRAIRLSKKDLAEVIELRELLEVYAISKITGKVSKESKDIIDDLLNQTREFAEKRDLAGYLEADRRFHVYLVSLADNDRMARLVDKLRQDQRMPALRRLVKTGDLIERVLEHEELVEAIVNGDIERSSQLIRDHIGLTWNEIERTSSPKK